jgi:hypothetical protein
MMKKPLNRIAIVLWILAIAIPIMEAIDVVYLNGLRVEAYGSVLPKAETYWLISNIATHMRLGLTNVALLAGLGYLIEIADQVRWDARANGKL